MLPNSPIEQISRTLSDLEKRIERLERLDQVFTINPAETVINEAGIDRNLRVEGTTEPNLLFIDAGDNNIGIGTVPAIDGGTVRLHVGGSGQQRIRIEDTTAVEHVDITMQAADGPAAISRAGTGGGDLFIYASGDMEIGRFGNVGVGILATPILGKVHIDQASVIAAIPVLFLDQADISEEMIQFETTIGVGNAIEAVGAKTLTITHFIKVTLPGGLTRYFPVGTIA